MAEYAYVRVSTKEQRLDRQLDALPASIPKENIFQEKESGKNFEDRPVWNQMMGILREGDTLFIKSIDRMGRNYREMGEVWRELTQRMGIHVVVLDMPILDTRGQNQLFQVLIADIVFALFSYVADNERTTIKARQREGIDAAMKRGVQFGPKFTITPQEEASFVVWSHGIRSPREWAHDLGMRDSTWRFRLRMWLEDPEKVRRNRAKLPDYEEQMEAFKERYGLGGGGTGPTAVWRSEAERSGSGTFRGARRTDRPELAAGCEERPRAAEATTYLLSLGHSDAGVRRELGHDRGCALRRAGPSWITISYMEETECRPRSLTRRIL